VSRCGFDLIFVTLEKLFSQGNVHLAFKKQSKFLRIFQQKGASHQGS